MAGPQTCRPDASDDGRLKGVFLLNADGEWEPAKNCLNRYSTIMPKEYNCGLNPGVTFAETLKKAFPDEQIGLIANARGATMISEWEKGTPYFDQAVKRAKQGTQGTKLAGILWLQGEQDTVAKENYKNGVYARRFGGFIRDLRAALGDEEIPFIMGEIWGTTLLFAEEWRPGIRSVNKQIRQVASGATNVALVKTKGIQHIAEDPVHFSPQGMRVLGRRYAKSYLKNWNK